MELAFSCVSVYLVLSLIWQSVANACECVKLPLHEAYCQSDFVVLARMKGGVRIRKTANYMINFDMEIRKVFVQDQQNTFAKGGLKTVFTPRTVDMCNAHVRKHTYYLIGGHIKRNNIYLTSCGLVKPWLEIPRHVRRALRKGQISCECSVTGCHNNKCVHFTGAETQTNKCSQKAHQLRDCYDSNGVCVANRFGKCGWSKTSSSKITKCKTKFESILLNNKNLEEENPKQDGGLLEAANVFTDLKLFMKRTNWTISQVKDEVTQQGS